MGVRVATPNDPKLSDRGAVRCSAWSAQEKVKNFRRNGNNRILEKAFISMDLHVLLLRRPWWFQWRSFAQTE